MANPCLSIEPRSTHAVFDFDRHHRGDDERQCNDEQGQADRNVKAPREKLLER
jgi:hypothetical protein